MAAIHERFRIAITETLISEVEVEATSPEEAERIAEQNWNNGEYDHVKQFCDDVSFSSSKVKGTPEVTLVEHALMEVSNERRIRLAQKEIDGPITVKALSEPTDPFGHRDIEYEYEISPNDMVMMLNWYRYQKAHGNESLAF